MTDEKEEAKKRSGRKPTIDEQLVVGLVMAAFALAAVVGVEAAFSDSRIASESRCAAPKGNAIRIAPI